jgi:hypothetical protein
MSCRRCGALECVQTGRFAGKLCMNCVTSLSLSAWWERSVRADARSKRREKYSDRVKLPFRPAS